MKGQITKLNIAISTLFLVNSTNILAADTLIKNGSFEDYSVHQDNGKSKSVALEHWQGIAEVWNSSTGKPAIKGEHKIQLDADDKLNILSQAITTVAGKKYRLSMHAYARRHRSSDIEVLIDGQLIATIKPNSQWSTYQTYFIGSGKKQRVSLKEVSHQNNGFGAVIDNVKLQESSELIVNGSFEDFEVTKDYRRWKLVNFTGWDGAGEVWDNRLGRRPTLGAYKIELDAGDELNSLAQTVQTEKDVTYTFSLDAYAKKWNSSDFEIWVDETKIADVKPESNWQRYSFNFVGKGKSQRIQLKEIDHQNDAKGAVIDHVSLVIADKSAMTVDTAEKSYNPYQQAPKTSSIKARVRAIVNKQQSSTNRAPVSIQKIDKVSIASKGIDRVIKVATVEQKIKPRVSPAPIKIIDTVDVARNFGKATQSKKGTYKKYQAANKAIDGNVNTHSQTQGTESKNWWQVELPNPTKISRIMVQGHSVYKWRLYGAKVYLSDSPYNGTLHKKDEVGILLGNSNKQWITFATPKSSSYLIVKARDRRHLSLATVEVYGKTPDSPTFGSHNQQYLIDSKISDGAKIATVNATDFQGDRLTYSIIENVPFSIDNQGVVRVKGNLLGKYNLTVQASDGKRSVNTSISIAVTSASAVSEALASGRVDSITDNELIDATLNEIATGQHKDISSSSLAKIKTLFTHFSHRDFNFNWNQCKDEKCVTVSGLKSEFEAGAIIVKKMVDTLDMNKINIFSKDGYRLQKLLVLTADKFRQQATYPMDKVLTDDTEFMMSYFADHVVYNYRHINPAQADMGNFSRSDFSHVTPVMKTLNIESQKDFRSTGAYALPGETVTITRNDNSDLTVSAFINSVRPKSTRQYKEEGYNRPKYLQTPHIEIKSGETIQLTSPYGGPIQLEFSQSGLPVSVAFSNVGEHPYWNGEEDNITFEQALSAGDYDWAEIATPVFEIHSTLEKMRESISNPEWGSVDALANAAVHYEYDLPHALAGYQGVGITPIAELHNFSNQQGWTIESVDKIKHVNADQASCSTGCAGNPYDTSWAYNPLKLGEVHELGHGLQGKKRFKGWNGHSMTNYYAYYSRYQYYQSTGKRLSCQLLPFKENFMVLQASVNAPDPVAYVKEHLWESHKWNKGTAMFIQMMMAVQHDGALQDGWLLRGRLHLFEREFERALNHEALWNEKRASLGMSHYSVEEAKMMDYNDWYLIALSYSVERDFRDYLAMWAISFSDKAMQQVESLEYQKLTVQYFKSKRKAYCKGLDQPVIALDGQQVW